MTKIEKLKTVTQKESIASFLERIPKGGTVRLDAKEVSERTLRQVASMLNKEYRKVTGDRHTKRFSIMRYTTKTICYVIDNLENPTQDE